MTIHPAGEATSIWKQGSLLIEQIYQEGGERLEPCQEHQVDHQQDVERNCLFNKGRRLTLGNGTGNEHQRAHWRR